MKISVNFAALILGLCMVAGFQLGYGQQTRTAKDLFLWWLDTDCGSGEEEMMKLIILKGEELTPMLIQVYEAGVDQDWVDKRVQADMKLVRANIDYLEKNKGQAAGLSKEDVEAFQKMNLEEYEKNLRENLQSGYMKLVLRGLMQTRSATAREYLGKIAGNRKEMHADYAKQLLMRGGE